MGKQGRKELCTTQKRKKKTLTPTDIPETERPSFRLILCKVNDVRMHQPTASLVTQPNVRPLHRHTNAGSLSTISNVFRPKPEIQRRLRIFHLATLKLWLYLAAKWKNQIVLLECDIMSSIITWPPSDVYEYGSENGIYTLWFFFSVSLSYQSEKLNASKQIVSSVLCSASDLPRHHSNTLNFWRRDLLLPKHQRI